jgi:hypothetical protein
MATDDKDKKDPPEGDPKVPAKTDPPDPDSLGDSGKKALDEERKARRDAEKVVADLQAKLKEIGDRDKSETEKLADRVAAAEKRADEAEVRVLRAEVALDKGLDPTLIKRLTGTTREELEADAEELKLYQKVTEGTPPEGGAKPNPAGRPREDLRGGGDPTGTPPVDLRKVIGEIPR